MLSPNNEKKPAGPKRFYKDVSIKKQGDVFAVFLDGKSVKTPNKNELLASNEALAGLVAAEWEEQEEFIDPHQMPITQILNTRIDKTPHERDIMTEQVLKFFDTDLICYYTDAPQDVLAMQKSAWNDAHLWFAQKSGEALLTTQDLAALKQSEKSHTFIIAYIDSLDLECFTILQMTVPLCGSLVLASAFCDGALDSDVLMKACFVEEDHKAILYNEAEHGGDPMLEKKRISMRRDLEAAEVYLATL